MKQSRTTWSIHPRFTSFFSCPVHRQSVLVAVVENDGLPAMNGLLLPRGRVVVVVLGDQLLPPVAAASWFSLPFRCLQRQYQFDCKNIYIYIEMHSGVSFQFPSFGVPQLHKQRIPCALNSKKVKVTAQQRFKKIASQLLSTMRQWFLPFMDE